MKINIKKIKMIAVFRVLYVYYSWKIKHENIETDIDFFSNGIKYFCKSLGLKENDLKIEDKNNLFDTLRLNCLPENDYFFNRLKKQVYNSKELFIYKLTIKFMILMLYFYNGFDLEIIKILGLRENQEENMEYLIHRLKNSTSNDSWSSLYVEQIISDPELIVAFNDFTGFINSFDYSIIQFEELKKHIKKIYKLFIKIDYEEIENRFDNSKPYLDKLEKIKPGKNEFRQFEELCHNILNFIFNSYGCIVEEQVLTYDGYQRRDALVYINSAIGILNILKEEYNCKIIICEFKNNKKKLNKDAISQIKYYMENEVYGQFGLLFVRNQNSNSLKKAQIKAYNYSQELILIFSDQDIKKILLHFSFIGNIDLFIKNKINKFLTSL